MSYAAFLALVSGKQPVWLYEFRRLGETVRFARAGADVEALSETWSARAVTHTRFMRTQAIGRAQTELVFPQSDAWARSYLGGGAYVENSVAIYHGFLNDPDQEFVCRFRGRVMGVKAAYTRIVLLAENQLTELRREARPAVMQRLCRHALYHTGCGVQISAFETEAALTGFSGRTATVTEAAAQADGFYAGGVLTYGGIRQSISRHTGSSLVLFGSIPNLASDLASSSGSLAVRIAPGCTLTRATCDGRFGNIANYGGFPWMDETPFDGKKLF